PAARTDGEGRFDVAMSVRDQVSFVFLKDGYASVEVRALDVDAAKNQAIRVVLEPGRRFACTVKDTNGRPIKAASVHLYIEADASVPWLFGRYSTDAEGRCGVAWLPA